MIINIDKNLNRLDITKTKKILCLSFRNYRPDLNFDFPSGAIEVNTYQASKNYFNCIDDFYLHVFALPYMDYLNYNIPKHILEIKLCFTQLDRSNFLHFSQGYLDSFKDLSEDNLWKCELNISQFIKGYMLDSSGSELVLLGETERDYFSFTYQGID